MQPRFVAVTNSAFCQDLFVVDGGVFNCALLPPHMYPGPRILYMRSTCTVLDEHYHQGCGSHDVLVQMQVVEIEPLAR